MFRAFILTLVEAFENKEDTYGYTYWDIVRGIRMANEMNIPVLMSMLSGD